VDIKGKALKLPVHQILGGAVRRLLRVLPTGGVGGRGLSWRDSARATIEAGYRAFRIDASAGGPSPTMSSTRTRRVRLVAQACKEVREGVGPNGTGTSTYTRNSTIRMPCAAAS